MRINNIFENKNQNRAAISILSIVIMLTFSSPYAVFGQNTTSDNSSANEASQDPIIIINSIKSILSDVSSEYNNQNYTGAEELAQIAYIDHYEYLEDPLEEKDPELMESTEDLLREDLVQSIQNEDDATVVDGLIGNITGNLSEAEALFSQ